MRLILTRHGETIENVQHIIQGHLPGRLSEKGLDQARKVAERLKDEQIDVIYSSDLARTADTTKEIFKFHPKTPVHFVRELRERYLAEFQGRTREELGLKKDESKEKLQSKTIESFDQMYERSKKFLDSVLHKHKDGTVLFAGHNGINKAIMCVIKGKTPQDILKTENFGNTSITIFEIDEEKNHTIHLYNCMKHLA
ncbi:histidine phosphatase family protein [Candidatus Woesearchaeota archaeon CG10_big_fil_rev_8_21_14_0_10_44_13]|nr:MAG: histidine phosphatase family protein [Candidatus Woesearchaeota archaeon CG10_big_fil_rev_8_21_14_0_10_44_13]